MDRTVNMTGHPEQRINNSPGRGSPWVAKGSRCVWLSWLTHLNNITWKSGAVTLEWQTMKVVHIVKKRNHKLFSSFLGITLLSLPKKVYNSVLSWSWNTGRTLYLLKNIWGCVGFCLTNLHVFCGLVQGFQPRAFGGCFCMSHSVLVQPLQELGPHCWQQVRLVPSRCWTLTGLPFVTILFIVFLDRISRQSQVADSGEITSLSWLGNALVFSPISWRRWVERGSGRLFCLGCCPHDTDLDKRKKMDGY